MVYLVKILEVIRISGNVCFTEGLSFSTSNVMYDLKQHAHLYTV